MLSKDINQALNDLISKGDLNKDPSYTMPGFQMNNIYPIFKHCFSEKALQTMQNKTQYLIYEYNEKVHAVKVYHVLAKLGLKTCKVWLDPNEQAYVRKADAVRYVAIRATKDKLVSAVEKVIATINHLADKDFTKASMVELGVLELAHPIDRGEPDFVVLSYITLTEAGYKYVQANMPKMFVNEGGIPARVEDQ